MPEDTQHPSDAHLIWQEQPKENKPVMVDHFVNRKTHQLHESTRSEIVMSMMATLFFLAVLAWRLPGSGMGLQPIGLAVATLWIGITAYRFRRILWNSGGPRQEVAVTGLSFYRRELEIRRDHLRNAWLWHGPLLVAGVIILATFAGRAFPGMTQVRNAAPLMLILLLWVISGVRRRFRQAANIQREIDEMSGLEERS